MIDMSTKEVKGRVFADPSKFMSNGVSYLFFEYFGTGANAEMEHVGKSKHFIESGYTEWFIPVSKVEKALGTGLSNSKYSRSRFLYCSWNEGKSFYG